MRVIAHDEEWLIHPADALHTPGHLGRRRQSSRDIVGCHAQSPRDRRGAQGIADVERTDERKQALDAFVPERDGDARSARAEVDALHTHLGLRRIPEPYPPYSRRHLEGTPRFRIRVEGGHAPRPNKPGQSCLGGAIRI